MSGTATFNTDVIITGNTTSNRFIGDISEEFIDPGINNQVLTTVAGVTSWADIEGLPAGNLNNVLVHDGNSYVSQAQINAGNIPNLSITTGKIVNGSVTLQKMANNSVNTPQIVAGAVIENRLDSNSVSTIKVQDNAITPDKLEEGTDGQVLTTVGTDVAWSTPVGATTIAFRNTEVVNSNAVFPFDGLALNSLGLTLTTNVLTGFSPGYYRFDFNAGYNDLDSTNGVTINLQDNTITQKAIRVRQTTLIGGVLGGSYTNQGYINNPTSVRYTTSSNSGSTDFNAISLFITKLS